MSRALKEQRAQYSGSAELFVEGGKRFDVDVRLIRYVDVVEVKTLAGVEYRDGVRSWDGRVDGLTELDRLQLRGSQMHLKLPDGGEGEVAFTENSTYIQGYGVAPF